MELLVVVALVLAGIALGRASAAERRSQELMQRLSALETRLGVPAGAASPPPVLPTGPQSDAGPQTIPVVQTTTVPQGTPAAVGGPPIWPEDLSPAVPPPPPAPRRPRGPSLWAPEFSRARISVAGGLLVLGGLAFTLRALGAPAWTLLLAVFAFGGLLYFNARRVPWPVSGALRGLGYGVAALGLGSLSQRLPDVWGPAAVLVVLFLLSAALLGDASRRREPLLGALAVSGAALSTWMLTDDLGRASISAAGLTLLLAAAAVWSGRAPGTAGSQLAWPDAEPERRAAQRAALPLTLAVAGAVPVGWLVASIDHLPPRSWEGPLSALAAALYVDTGFPALLPWLLLSLLALAIPLALLSRPALNDPPLNAPALNDSTQVTLAEPAALGAVWATLIPQALVALAVGTALDGAVQRRAEVACVVGILLALLAASRVAWRHASGPDSGLLVKAASGGLIAGAAGVTGSLAVSLLGSRTEALALSGIAGALLLVGVYGRSRFWIRMGGLGLAGAAALGTVRVLGSRAGIADDLWFWDGRSLLPAARPDVVTALLGAAPSAFAALAALRLAPLDWADQGGSRTRWTARLLAPLGSLGVALALMAGGSVPVWVWCAVAALGLIGLAGMRSAVTPATRLVGVLAGAPGLAVGALFLLSAHTGPEALLGISAALLAGVAFYRASRVLERPTIASGTLVSLGEVAALAFVVLGLSRAAALAWPALGTPGVLAVTALGSVSLRWHWTGGRQLDVLLSLGALVLLGAVGADPVARHSTPAVGAALLLGAWALTRTASGLSLLARVARDLPAVSPQTAVARTYWGAGLLTLTLLASGSRLSGSDVGQRPWLVLASGSALLVGLHACVQAHRAAGSGSARAWWNAGLIVIILAGLKGALLDAWSWPNPPAALGLSVLIMGLSLLAVAILAPRPGGPEPVIPPLESSVPDTSRPDSEPLTDDATAT
ncbi:hypothetical protein [Deinococcus sp.]|uniref:hypothetical protein n=1 Tax=Deinococcus sp. TaxID=47478 RepID=UPI002869DB22|nr:hypothetical protein [Deinococcus sp.]